MGEFYNISSLSKQKTKLLNPANLDTTPMGNGETIPHLPSCIVSDMNARLMKMVI